MKIEKTTLIEFDESKERLRILFAFKGSKKTNLRKWLLAILEAFVAHDWDKAIEHAKNAPDAGDDKPLEYLHPVVYDTLKDYAEAKHLREAFAQSKKKSADDPKGLIDISGVPTDPDRFDYPRFKILATEAAPSV